MAEVSDGTRLCLHTWRKANSSSPTKQILLLPGIGLHGAIYDHLGSALAKKGALFYALDYRGHGMSDRLQGGYDPARRIVEDINDIVRSLVTITSTSTVSLIGESTGALFALMYVSVHSSLVDRQVLIAPALNLHPRQIDLRTTVLPFLRGLLSPRSLTIDINGRPLELSTRSREFLRLRRTDPLVIGRVSPKHMFDLYRMIIGWKIRYAYRVTVPTLLLHGGRDQLIAPTTTRELYKLIPTQEKKIKVYKEAYHTLLWDPVSDEVIRDIEDWFFGQQNEIIPPAETEK